MRAAELDWASKSTSEAWKYIRGQTLQILQDIDAFGISFKANLPFFVSDVAQDFSTVRSGELVQDGRVDNEKHMLTKAGIELQAFEAQITFLLSGTQDDIRSRAERAFTHRNRVLAVDADVRAKSPFRIGTSTG